MDIYNRTNTPTRTRHHNTSRAKTAITNKKRRRKKAVIILDLVRSGPQIDLHSPLPPFLDDSSVYNTSGIPTVHMAEYNNVVEYDTSLD